MLCDPLRCYHTSLVDLNLRIEEDSLPLFLFVFFYLVLVIPAIILTQNASPFRSNARAL